MSRIAVVVPTIRQDCIRKFLQTWSMELQHCMVVIVEDSPNRSFDLDGSNCYHYSWQEIDQDLGENAWIIPRRTDCIRSYGFLKAVEQGAEVILSLDDDCFPSCQGFVRDHVKKLDGSSRSEAWVSTVGKITPRGVPYYNRYRFNRVYLNHGLWTGIPDFDAVTQLACSRAHTELELVDQVIPPGYYFPMCGMNVAFRKELAPAMYFLLMGPDWPYDRFGDIWCGVLAKKICDHLGYGVTSGQPHVRHERASNVWVNLRKEATGYEANEDFWQAVDSIVLRGTTVKECYVQLADELPLRGEYWEQLRLAMKIWADLVSRADATSQLNSDTVPNRVGR
jgi:reversibly glycosylated polypeptide/UDP-arabinopyranose mutase